MGESYVGSRAGSVGCSEHHSQRFFSLRELKIAISLLERALYVSYNPLGGTGPAPEAVSGPKLFLTWVGHYVDIVRSSHDV